MFRFSDADVRVDLGAGGLDDRRHGDLHRAGSERQADGRVGFGQGHCVITLPNRPLAQCTSSLFFDHGQIATQGPNYFNRPFNHAITGGTGVSATLPARCAPSRCPVTTGWKITLKVIRPWVRTVWAWHFFSDTDFDLAPERVKELVESGEAQLVDVREDYEWEAGRIAGAVHIELERLPGRAAEIDKDKPVVFQCRLGAPLRVRGGGVPQRRLRRVQHDRRHPGLGRGGPTAGARGRDGRRPLVVD